jgi:phage N-6-adenine-methyltransferase
MQDVHFKSGNKEWETPEEVFQPLKKEFNIVLDVCAAPKNTKCGAYYDRKYDGLRANWSVGANALKGNCWMNPPYGRG